MRVILDSTPLGMATNPNASADSEECSRWLEALLAKGVTVRVPEICDYEIRRELLRAKKARGLQRLDDLKAAIGYIPLDTRIMLKAAELWAAVRNIGLPTAGDEALDGDVILAAQAILTSNVLEQTIIATQNVAHLSRFDTPTVTAMEWRDVIA